MKQTIAIVGHGYVGQALERYFENKYHIVIHDPAKGLDDREAVNSADLALICVPTNMKDDGSVNLDEVHSVFAWLTTPLVCIKSTIPPGTTEELVVTYNCSGRVVFSPEFIGEGGYPIPYWEDKPHPTDMRLHRHLVFGGDKEASRNIIPFFERVSGPFCSYHTTNATTAELCKYMENSWIATKVTFCNEFYDVAAAFDVDWHELRELWLTDGRVGQAHTLVYKEKRGFDGKCIPKDTNGIVLCAKKAGYNMSLLEAVLKRNREFQSQR